MKKATPVRTVAAALLFLAIFILCVFIGSVTISAGDTLRILLSSLGIGDTEGINQGTVAIIREIRMPRALAASLVGAMLASAGAAMQGFTQNPLADGSTLGVASGGTLGAVLVIAFGASTALSLPIVSIIFAFVFLVIVMAVSYAADKNMSGTTIILCGVVLSMFTSGLISLIIALRGDALERIIFWTMGSFSGRNYTQVLILLVFAAAGIGILLLRHRELDILALGDESAANLGVPVRCTKLTLMAATALLVGPAVAFTGAIGFVGLAVPHITRVISGSEHRKMLPINIFIGASFMMLADLFARAMPFLGPRELPVGVITQIVGAVFFVAIFVSTRRKRGT